MISTTDSREMDGGEWSSRSPTSFESASRMYRFTNALESKYRMVDIALPAYDDEAVLWDPGLPGGGLRRDDLARARIVLWKGWCPVHCRSSRFMTWSR